MARTPFTNELVARNSLPSLLIWSAYTLAWSTEAKSKRVTFMYHIVFVRRCLRPARVACPLFAAENLHSVNLLVVHFKTNYFAVGLFTNSLRSEAYKIMVMGADWIFGTQNSVGGHSVIGQLCASNYTQRVVLILVHKSICFLIERASWLLWIHSRANFVNIYSVRLLLLLCYLITKLIRHFGSSKNSTNKLQ